MNCWYTGCTLAATTTISDGTELCDMHLGLLRSFYTDGGTSDPDLANIAAFQAAITPQGS